MSILAVMEQRGGAWNRMSFETLAAAGQFARELDTTASAAVLGQSIGPLAAELASRHLEKVYAVEHALLQDYTPDGYTLALRQLVEVAKPSIVLFPQTYQVRDFLPKLAASLGKVAVSDAISHRVDNGQLVLTRQLFQGKLNVDSRFAGDAPHFASLQAGAYPPDPLAAPATEGSPHPSSEVEKFAPRISPGDIRTRPLELFRESQHSVDLGAAAIIVSVGRGIKESANIRLVEKLAQALGGELGASRPICDAGWLPNERQVGSSGQTVAPKMYMAIGISGAIQHLVGMKASRTIVAINRDPDAPIFEVADYGIAGDLFQVVPALLEALQKPK
jgi:electron transfer flavoprotein alpha subunit